MSQSVSIPIRQSDTLVRDYGFNLLYIKRFWRLQKILFPSLLSDSLALLIFLLILAVSEEFLAYNIGLISGQFFEVLGKRDFDGFTSTVLQSSSIIALMTVAKSTKSFVSNTMVVAWRRKLTRGIHKLYLAGTNFYQLNVMNKTDFDNPDQRITADVEIFCKTYGDVLTDIIISPFTIAYYAYSAFSRAGWIGPSSTFLFFLISSVFNKFLMSPIAKLTVEREKQEGNFRFRHATLRGHAESLAFLGSEAAAIELESANLKLDALCSVQQRVVNWQLALNVATNGFGYFGSIVSFLVISVPIFEGSFDNLTQPELSRLISENNFVCLYLIFQFTKLVDLASTVSTLAGVTHRIGELFEVLQEINNSKTDNSSEANDQHESSKKLSDDQGDGNFNPPISNMDVVAFSFRNFDLKIPFQDSVLIRNLSVDFMLNQNVVITGKSSTGKSSFLRVLRGLWEESDNKHIFRGDHTKFYIPQKMFLCDRGSLRNQITYPNVRPSMHYSDDQQMLATLRELDMLHLLDRCGGSLDTVPTFNWSDELSPGELQRLMFARLFFHKPKIAVLDEATSALSAEMEETIYRRCMSYNMTLISVAHRESLKKFHQVILEIGLPNGGWKLTFLDLDRPYEVSSF